jgi:nicotinate-nucleotide adenylyltransferase
LLQALVDDLGDPRVTLQQALSSPRALDTLERAAARWPQHELVFVVGGDLAAQLPRWYRAEELLQRCRLAVVPRQGYQLDPTALETLRQLGGRPELLDLAIPASASSAIRQRPSPDQVPAALWPELVKHNLYGLGQQPSRPSR